MKNNEIHDLVNEALKVLLAKDADLLEKDAGERGIVGRLHQYLIPLFPDHTVDTEYDKHGIDPKRLELPPACRGGGLKRAIPDVIVHRRGNDDNNLLAIEIKKETNRQSRECDRAKLQCMKDQLHYQTAVLIELPAGVGASQRHPKLEWIQE